MVLRGMFRENNDVLRKELRKEIREEIQANNKIIRDEIHSAVVASERRVTTNIADLLDTSVLPQIAELQRDMTIVKRHLQLA